MSAIATPAQIELRTKKVDWYNDDLSELDPAAQAFIAKYTGLPSERVVPHILEIVGLVLMA